MSLDQSPTVPADRWGRVALRLARTGQRDQSPTLVVDRWEVHPVDRREVRKRRLAHLRRLAETGSKYRLLDISC